MSSSDEGHVLSSPWSIIQLFVVRLYAHCDPNTFCQVKDKHIGHTQETQLHTDIHSLKGIVPLQSMYCSVGNRLLFFKGLICDILHINISEIQYVLCEYILKQ